MYQEKSTGRRIQRIQANSVAYRFFFLLEGSLGLWRIVFFLLLERFLGLWRIVFFSSLKGFLACGVYYLYLLAQFALARLASGAIRGRSRGAVIVADGQLSRGGPERHGQGGEHTTEFRVLKHNIFLVVSCQLVSSLRHGLGTMTFFLRKISNGSRHEFAAAKTLIVHF